MNAQHWAILVDNSSPKTVFIESLLKGPIPKGLEYFKDQQGLLFSKKTLSEFIDEEEKHDRKIITDTRTQNLKTMSSGEQKKVLLAFLLEQAPDFIILDNVFDHLDSKTRETVKTTLQKASTTISLIQVVSRKTDILVFTEHMVQMGPGGDIDHVLEFEDRSDSRTQELFVEQRIPEPLEPMSYDAPIVIKLKDIRVSYEGRCILDHINWTIEKGSFWELRGANGSGKTTILSMITGENPKGYGQELYLFGQKKGSGESVWELKQKIGYFTPAMTDNFTGYHSVIHMVISGLYDSIGLYIRPTAAQLRLAKAWLQLIGMWHLKDALFQELGTGQKRMVMCIRAMIKHPVLLILDEPTTGLDDESARMFVSLVNRFAQESDTTVIFVSHRSEPGLNADQVYQLTMTPKGAKGEVLY